MSVIWYSKFTTIMIIEEVNYMKKMEEYLSDFPNSSTLMFKPENFENWKGGQEGVKNQILFLTDPSMGDRISFSEGMNRLKEEGHNRHGGICELAALKNYIPILRSKDLRSANIRQVFGAAPDSLRRMPKEYIALHDKISLSIRFPKIPYLDLIRGGLHLHLESGELTEGHYFLTVPKTAFVSLEA